LNTPAAPLNPKFERAAAATLARYIYDLLRTA
jgi:hypothetical protein